MSLGQAISPDLREWIVTQMRAGHSVESLRLSMRQAGWSSHVAEAALAEMQGETTLRGAEASGAAQGSPVPGPDLSQSPLYIECGGQRVQILQTMKRPNLVVFGNLVSSEECEFLIRKAKERLARSLTVETRTGGEALNVDRTSDGMFFERGENDVVARLEQRIADLVAWPVIFGEGLQVLRYQPGAQYRPHYDYFDPAEPGTPSILKRGGQRVATLVMYLQEPEQGGATTFPDVGLEVAPKQGTGVFFTYDRPDSSTRTLHGGAPVLAGEKWVATKWLREREFK
ncbi:Prolyl 4-hydroxylase [Burkholderiales bacterium 8X]|nr:Prolyl 4-hydroxylase [Burkholderiales bacterium 8X]